MVGREKVDESRPMITKLVRAEVQRNVLNENIIAIEAELWRKHKKVLR